MDEAVTVFGTIVEEPRLRASMRGPVLDFRVCSRGRPRTQEYAVSLLGPRALEVARILGEGMDVLVQGQLLANGREMVVLATDLGLATRPASAIRPPRSAISCRAE